MVNGVNLFNVFSVLCGDYRCCCCCWGCCWDSFIPTIIRNSRILQQTFYIVIVYPSLFVFVGLMKTTNEMVNQFAPLYYTLRTQRQTPASGDT